jgi:hypothetical protein
MTRFRDMPEAEIGRLLGGQEPDDAAFLGVSRFLKDLDSVIAEESTGALEAAHLAAMSEAAQLPLDAGAADAAGVLGSWRSWRLAWRQSVVFGRLAAHKWVAAGALATVGILSFGGATYAGVLPAPIQRATAALVKHAGIVVPTPRDAGQASLSDLHEITSSGTGSGGTTGSVSGNGGSSSGSSSSGVDTRVSDAAEKRTTKTGNSNAVHSDSSVDQAQGSGAKNAGERTRAKATKSGKATKHSSTKKNPKAKHKKRHSKAKHNKHRATQDHQGSSERLRAN